MDSLSQFALGAGVGVAVMGRRTRVWKAALWGGLWGTVPDLDALIDRLIADHGADPARIFMTGGSNGGMMTFVYAVTRPERLAAVAPVVASMFSFDAMPRVPLPILIINGAKDEEVPLAGGMSGNALVRGAQATPFKPVREVVDFWVKANKSTPEGKSTSRGSVTTTTYTAQEGGAVTEFIVDSAAR